MGRKNSSVSRQGAHVRLSSQPQSLSCTSASPSWSSQLACTLLRSSPPSSASPSRWSRPVFPSLSPSSRGLLSLPVSQLHLFWLAPLRSVPWLASLSSTFSLSTQQSSARLNLSQLPASLMCPPGLSNLPNEVFHTSLIYWLFNWHY